MSVLAIGSSVMFAAAGYSLLYLLMGGELGGAILIFIVAKMLGREAQRDTCADRPGTCGWAGRLKTARNSAFFLANTRIIPAISGELVYNGMRCWGDTD